LTPLLSVFSSLSLPGILIPPLKNFYLCVKRWKQPPPPQHPPFYVFFVCPRHCGMVQFWFCCPHFLKERGPSTLFVRLLFGLLLFMGDLVFSLPAIFSPSLSFAPIGSFFTPHYSLYPLLFSAEVPMPPLQFFSPISGPRFSC